MEQLKKNWKELLLLTICTALIIGVAWALFRWQQVQQEELRKAQEITQAQEQSMEKLQAKLKISEDNSRELGAAIKGIQQAQNATVVPDTSREATSPIVTFTVPAATVEEASADVAERIHQGDMSLPDEAIQASDRTVVTPITTDIESGATLPEQERRVDVYKIDLRKDHRIKAGVAAVGGDAYVVVGYEQGRTEGLVFVGQRGAGGTLLYNIAEW
jgi:hypothetical protein